MYENNGGGGGVKDGCMCMKVCMWECLCMYKCVCKVCVVFLYIELIMSHNEIKRAYCSAEACM